MALKSHEYKEGISALSELQGRLKDHKGYYDRIDGIIKELGNLKITDLTKQRIRACSHKAQHAYFRQILPPAALKFFEI